MLVHVLCHLFVHLSLLHVVFAARASSVADWNEQNQLSSSDGEFEEGKVAFAFTNRDMT